MSNEEEQEFLIEQDQQRRLAQSQFEEEQRNMAKSSLIDDERNKGMAQEQLDLSKEIERIENLLRGRVFRKNQKTGVMEWMKPENSNMKVLTEEGIHFILNTISFYLNKNTLLSNYDETTINIKLEDFAESLNDSLYMNYEKFYITPTEEECYKVLLDRLKSRLNTQKYKIKLETGEEVSKEETKKIYEKLRKEINVVRELKHIKDKWVKNNLKHHDIIMREIQDVVHSCYQRAWKGMERTSLRKHMSLSEIRNPDIPSQNKSSGGIMKWFKR